MIRKRQLTYRGVIPLFYRLSTRFAVAASALAVFFVLLMGGGAWLVTTRLIQQQINTAIQSESALLARRLADRLDGVARNFHHMAGNPALSVAAADPRLLNQVLAPLLRNLTEMDGFAAQVWMTDHTGRPMAGRPPPGDELSNWISGAVMSRASQARLIHQDGQVAIMAINALAGDGGLVWVMPLAPMLRSMAGDGFGMAMDVLATVDGQDIRLPVGPTNDGVVYGEMVRVELPVQTPALSALGIRLQCRVNDSLFADAYGRLTSTFLFIALIAMVLSVVLASLLAQRLTQALTRLTQAASNYSIGAGDPAVFALSGHDEIARLGFAFSQMIDRLARAYRDLERRSQTLLSNAERIAQVGSASLDVVGGRYVWSDQFYALLGLSPGSVAAEREVFLHHVHPDDRQGLMDCLDGALTTGQRFDLEFRVCPSGGLAQRVCQLRAEVVADDELRPQRVDIAIQDITARKQMEDRLDSLVRDLRRSNEELEQFAYAASHDLRQPLRTVRSYVSLIEEGLAGRLDTETQEFMDFIRDGVKRMDALITDLLSYSRVGRTSQEQSVPLGQSVSLALLDLQPEIDDTGAVVQVSSELPSIMGDPGELARLFQNLIGNAVKYRDPDRPPLISVGVRDQGDQWLIWVRDNGIGIPSEYQERVFGIFQRLHARDEYEGTGIGLAICRKIVQGHGGKIWFESRPAHGTTFKFTWPKLPRVLA